MDYLIQCVDISYSYDIIIKYIIYSDKLELLDYIPVCEKTIYYLLQSYQARYKSKTYPDIRKSYVSKLHFSSLKEVYDYIIYVYERDNNIIKELFENFEENIHYVTDEFYNLWLKKRTFSRTIDLELEKFVALNYPNDVKTSDVPKILKITKPNYVKFDIVEDADYFIFQYSDKCFRMYKYTEATIRFYYYIYENNYDHFISEEDTIKITNMYEELSIYSDIIACVWCNELYQPFTDCRLLHNPILFFYSKNKLIDITEHRNALMQIYETTLKLNNDLIFSELYNIYDDYVYQLLPYLIEDYFLSVDLNNEIVITIYENMINKKSFFNSLLYSYLMNNKFYTLLI